MLFHLITHRGPFFFVDFNIRVYISVIANTSQNPPENSAKLDDLELDAVGYQRSMPRQLSFWLLGALSFALTCTWLGTGSSVGISLTEASSAGILWSLPIAGMAELVSAFPVAGAHYYWYFMIASDDYKAFASYL